MIVDTLRGDRPLTKLMMSPRIFHPACCAKNQLGLCWGRTRPLESAVLESVRCPSCSTQYGLRANRVRAGIRRAKCFRCDAIFNIGQEVLRLIRNQSAAEPVPSPEPGPLETRAVLVAPQVEVAPSTPAPAEVAKAGELPNLDFFLEEQDAAVTSDLSKRSVLDQSGQEPTPPSRTPLEPDLDIDALMLGDLEGDNALMHAPVQSPSSPAPEAGHQDLLPESTSHPSASPSKENADETVSYASARDAINKLLGGGIIPLPSPDTSQSDMPVQRSRNRMDVEATLDALETTLSGTSSEAIAPKTAELPSFPTSQSFASASTLKLSASDIQSAIVQMTSPTPSKGISPSQEMPTTSPSILSTVPQMPTMGTEAPAEHPSASSDSTAPPSDQALLKVQVGSEIYQNLSTEQMTRWIEEGRILEYHMVSRQLSENWIEASKVPVLRPVFDRVRRTRSGSSTSTPTTPAETAPAKKSLFGGLFKG